MLGNVLHQLKSSELIFNLKYVFTNISGENSILPFFCQHLKMYVISRSSTVARSLSNRFSRTYSDYK